MKRRTVLFTLCLSLATCADYNRDYTGTYDFDSGRVGAEVRVTGAAHPGEGRPSFGLRATGTLRSSPDFKSVVPEMKGVAR